MSTHHPIAIIGGGLGGLTAARVLHANGITSTVFELESSRHNRVQGGMLDIHEHNGQQAIRAAGLWDQFKDLIHPGGEAMRILDKNANVLREEADSGDLTRPEVERGQLRDLLIDSLPEGFIKWGHKATAVRPMADAPGRHEVEFANGETITTDLLIGADGAWSKVRPLLSEAWPAYSGVSFIETDLHNAAVDHPAEAEAMGGGMLFALDGNTGILGHLETDGSLHSYLGLRVPQDWIGGIDFTNTDVAKKRVLAELDGWHESLRGMMEHADTALTARRINALPVGHSWDRVPGVTLLGDAAHVMSPFAGEGANLAMFDGAQLALALAAHRDDLDAALTAYEQDLFPRSAESARESAESLELIFREDSPTGLVEMFASFDDQRAAVEAHTAE